MSVILGSRQRQYAFEMSAQGTKRLLGEPIEETAVHEDDGNGQRYHCSPALPRRFRRGEPPN